MSTDKSRMLIRIGGEAGQGLETVGEMLAKALVRSGYEVLTTQSAMSRIRGGHNYFSILTGTESLAGPAEEVDLLVAFTQETVDLHKNALAQGSLILMGQDMDNPGMESVLNVPYAELAADKIVANVVGLGVISAIIGLEEETVSGVVRDALGSKHEDMLSKNLKALKQGIQWTSRQSFDFQPLPQRHASGSRLAINGNEAIALGALTAGVDFCSFYPMTPATSVALNLISYADEYGVVCEQAEDEIAVINMALGASFCGARSLVPTSGGGFALMGEGISLAGMTETPILVVLAQRPGPATGLPTRTEQGDLELALASGHGEFPRAIMAPGNPQECFHLTIKALDLAEKYQIPVILLTDQYLANSIRAVQPFDLSRVSQPQKPEAKSDHPESYQRFAWSESGISPRLIPGAGKHLVVADSDEHTPDGHITEDHQVRVGMVNKRLKKLEGLVQETLPPAYAGDDDPELLLMTWGSSQGPVLEAAAALRHQGQSVATMVFSQVWPLNPGHFEDYLGRAGRVVSVEGNATGQLAKLIRRETGFQVQGQVLRYDGLPMTSADILRQLQS
ncbi:MAG: 2-oxoacid:acceptor oxidoreductase subunit alpha [Desulfovermiculus sp.]|nr:2-oxoacid:acceptor oxidoreductase subunit alpha [Desulfovermiculus sp.]